MITSGDFDGDGKQDLVLGDGYHQLVHVIIGNGDGTFQTQTEQLLTGRNQVLSIAVTDLNRDGKLDLIIVGDEFQFSVMLGNGDGTFQFAAVELSIETVENVVVADFNADNAPDLAFGYGVGVVGVLLNRPFASCF